MKYEKVYTRENSLIAFEILQNHQTEDIKYNIVKDIAKDILYNVEGGLGEIYYEKNTVRNAERKIAKRMKEKSFIKDSMEWYKEILQPLQKAWKKKTLKDINALLEFYGQAVAAWSGLDISYWVPDMKEVKPTDKKIAMEMREVVADFLENTDHVIQNTLRHLYLRLGDGIKYVSIEEVRRGKIPSKRVLEARKKHYIYYGSVLDTDCSFEVFCKKQNIQLPKKEKVFADSDVKGQIAMTGTAQGVVRVVLFKVNIKDVKKDEILVTTMTTPDYLPAMKKAAAFITDEGGITCHAAIVAREFGKPCIIGTKIATQVFKDGDMVEVDANKGVVRKI